MLKIIIVYLINRFFLLLSDTKAVKQPLIELDSDVRDRSHGPSARSKISSPGRFVLQVERITMIRHKQPSVFLPISDS